MACGAKEGSGALAPLNAVSHIAWGDEAFSAQGFSARHTLTGLAANTAANVSWGVLYELLLVVVKRSDAARDAAARSDNLRCIPESAAAAQCSIKRRGAKSSGAKGRAARNGPPEHCAAGAWSGAVSRALPGGALVAALAYVTDYHIVPARLTPGFEKHLSRRALFFIYLVLALALAAGGALHETLRADAD